MPKETKGKKGGPDKPEDEKGKGNRTEQENKNQIEATEENWDDEWLDSSGQSKTTETWLSPAGNNHENATKNTQNTFNRGNTKYEQVNRNYWVILYWS